MSAFLTFPIIHYFPADKLVVLCFLKSSLMRLILVLAYQNSIFHRITWNRPYLKKIDKFVNYSFIVFDDNRKSEHRKAQSEIRYKSSVTPSNLYRVHL